MVSDGRVRASDADRDRTAAALREHFAAGRLTAGEFDERLDKAYAAKTLGELDGLMTDLPGIDLEPLPDMSLHRLTGSLAPQEGSGGPVEARQGRFSLAWRAAWGSWLAISVMVFAVWVVSGASGGLWFLWVVLPLGALLLARWIVGVPARSERRPALPRHNPQHRGSGSARPLTPAQGAR
jgi:DUF1707 SHOCT-like domain